MSMEVACLVYLRSIGMNMGNGGVGDGQSPRTGGGCSNDA